MCLVALFFYIHSASSQFDLSTKFQLPVAKAKVLSEPLVTAGIVKLLPDEVCVRWQLTGHSGLKKKTKHSLLMSVNCRLEASGTCSRAHFQSAAAVLLIPLSLNYLTSSHSSNGFHLQMEACCSSISVSATGPSRRGSYWMWKKNQRSQIKTPVTYWWLLKE